MPDVLCPLIILTVSACATSVATLDAIEQPFAATGDPGRGREVFTSREGGHCVLCHSLPGIDVAGDVGPSLAGVGTRLTPAQIRLRVADITRVNPNAVMPSFHRTEGLHAVAPERRGKPVLSGQQVEDVVAWLATFK
jgi:sulfur-oxidizing protein SoxX